MGIVFFCQSCGARFEVASSMAGKRGHCKKCGQVMTIPRAEEIASMSAMPALAMAGAGASPAAGPPVGASIASALRAGVSNIKLAPLTIDRMPVGRMLLGRKGPAKPSPLDDAEDSKPYALAKPVRESRGRAHRQANVVLNLWRRQVGAIQKIFRKINQAAYLISVPFLMVLIAGVVVQNRQLAILGATAVVLLNIGRLVAGAANLALVPLRDGANAKKMKKPLGRVIEPAVTIGLVVLAFTFIPWLSRGASAKGDIVGQIRAGAQDLRKDIKGEVDRYVDVDQLAAQAHARIKDLGDRAKEIDVSKLGSQAQEKLKELGDKAKEQLGGSQTAPRNQPPAEKRTGPVRAAVEALEKRTQEELDKAKALEELPKQP
jgi:hypothetical protein